MQRAALSWAPAAIFIISSGFVYGGKASGDLLLEIL